MARGEESLQGLCNHSVEHRLAGIPRCVGGNRWRHTSPHGQEGEDGRARICPLLYCTYVQYTSKMFGWGKKETSGMHRVVRAAAGAKYRLKFLYTCTPGGVSCTAPTPCGVVPGTLLS